MQIVGTFKAKSHLLEMLAQVVRGEQFIITKHGYPIAKLVPFYNVDQEKVSDVIFKLKEFGKRYKLKGLDWKKLRGEGRK